jgi:hypothetical protein
MPQDKFLIAPIENGLQTNLRPFLIMDDAFERLSNAYTFRGRVRKRFGEDTFGLIGLNRDIPSSRLRVRIGVLTGAHGLAVTVPGSLFAVGQMFSIGDEFLTVTTTGLPAPLLDSGVPPCAVATFNTTTGALVIAGSAQPAGTPVYFYPASPVMGIASYETGTTIDLEPLYAFDYQFAYKFTIGLGTAGWERSGVALFHGGTEDYFWTTSWAGALPGQTAFFVTNFHVQNPSGAGAATDDLIWQTGDGTTWATFKPYFAPAGGAVNTGPFVQSARIIIPFHDRLLLFNTIENNNAGGFGVNTHYPNRCRYSASIKIASPFAVNAWYEFGQTDAVGNTYIGAGWANAPTDEQIVSVCPLKDKLIVYCENSTWELTYKQNEIVPFEWQKINTELGAVSTNSIVPFDKVVLGVDNIGIHACNGFNVERTDTKIPDQVFQIDNASVYVAKVAGVRDYVTELVYWSYKGKDSADIWPNKILVYNYRNGSWAIFDDCITSFGYVTQQTGIFEYATVVAGNQQGYTFVINPDIYRNAPAMQITKMADFAGVSIDLTVINHALTLGDFIVIENAQGCNAAVNNKVYEITNIAGNIVTAFPLVFTSSAGYKGGGTVTRVSKIDILSKQYNPYIGKASNFAINKIDFAVEKTTNGKILVDYYTSSSSYSTVANSVAIAGTNVLDTFSYPTVSFEAQQARLWHTIYFDTEGDCIQLHMYLSNSLINDRLVAFSNFELDAMLFYVQPTGRVS